MPSGNITVTSKLIWRAMLKVSCALQTAQCSHKTLTFINIMAKTNIYIIHYLTKCL